MTIFKLKDVSWKDVELLQIDFPDAVVVNRTVNVFDSRNPEGRTDVSGEVPDHVCFENEEDALVAKLKYNLKIYDPSPNFKEGMGLHRGHLFAIGTS